MAGLASLAGQGGPAQGQHDLGGVVGVGVVVVVELEGPAARGQGGPADLPVARAADLLAEHPSRGADQGRVIGGQARVGQADHGQHGVPDRRLARLEAAHRAVRALLGDREPVKAAQSALHDGVLDVVAEQVQRHQRVHPGRLDAAPAAVPLLPGDDPLRAPPQRGPPYRLYRPVKMKGLVQGGEDVGPGVGGGARAGEGARVEGAARAGGAAVRAAGLQLVDGERERAGRAERLDDGQGHDGLPGPAAPVVDVEREPGRQVDQLGRDDRQVVPRPPAGQGQPDPGEHAGGLDAALGQDPVAGPLHVRSVRLVAGQPQRHVGLDRGGQVAGPAVEVGPGAVVPLLMPDPARRRRDRLVVVQAEELAQQQVLGVHGDVGLELALPPALRVLQAEHVVTRSVQGVAGEIEDRGVSYHWRAVMNSAIAVSSARTSAGRSMSARLALAAASCGVGLGLGPLLAARGDDQVGRADQVVLGQRPRVGEQGVQVGGLGRAAGQRGHHRQRLLAGPQVGAHRLAGDLGRAPDAEQVVGELEGQPDVRAEPGQGHGQRGRGAEVHRADAARAGHQRGGLVARHLQALGQGHVVALLEGQVRALPGDQPLHRGGQAAGRPGTLRGAVLEQHVLGQGQQRVAGQDGRRRCRTRSRRWAGAGVRCRRP